MKRLFLVSCVLGLILSAGFSAESNRPAAKTCAIFIANRADIDENEQMAVFEDLIAAQVTGIGLEVISRDVALGAAADLLKQSKKNSLDALLDEQTSALNLARNLGADYLLFASFAGLDHEQRSVNSYGVRYDNHTYTLRGTYRILDGNTGGSMASGVVEPSRTIQQTKHSQTSTTGLMRELMARAGREVASGLRAQAGQIRDVRVAEEKVNFQVAVTLDEVSFPQATVDAEGHVSVASQKGRVEALGVSVEMDGFVVGSTGSSDSPTILSASPGLHRIRLSRDDLVPYERMVNLSDGMTLNIVMQLNDEGLKRWRENIKGFNALLLRTKLNDAEVERIRAEAQQLRQSGYKVDFKMDTDEGITMKKNQSLMNQD